MCHCSGVDNPADLMTRGVFPDALLASTLWLAGPAWLASDDPVQHGAPPECDVWSGAAEAVVCKRSDVSDVSPTPTDSATEPMVPALPAAAADSFAGDGELVSGTGCPGRLFCPLSRSPVTMVQ